MDAKLIWQTLGDAHVNHHLIQNLEHKGIIKIVTIYKNSEHIKKDSRGGR
jgi:hypothetical protein